MRFAFAPPLRRPRCGERHAELRYAFKPSEALAEPRAILAVAAIAADSDAEAERIATSADLHFVRRVGRFVPLASPDEAAAYPYAPVDRLDASQDSANAWWSAAANWSTPGCWR